MVHVAEIAHKFAVCLLRQLFREPSGGQYEVAGRLYLTYCVAALRVSRSLSAAHCDRPRCGESMGVLIEVVSEMPSTSNLRSDRFLWTRMHAKALLYSHLGAQE